MSEMTPMMRQYLEIKEKNKDAILFYRLGDFYEMFFEDAKVASKELELVLTGRDCGQAERAPMCGVPYHSCESYIARLISRGYKVAVCEQMEDPKAAKGIVKRDIVRIITPGTVTDTAMLDDKKNNYIAAVNVAGDEAGLAFADVSTGEFFTTTMQDEDGLSAKLINELAKYAPAEVLLNPSALVNVELNDFVTERLRATISTVDTEADDIANHFGALPELRAHLPAYLSCNMLLCYLKETQKNTLANLKTPLYYTGNQYMELDYNTRRNLELCETMRRGEKKGSLLWVLDKTKSAMGARLLRRWIEQPLCSLLQINSRQNAVLSLVKNKQAREELAECLKEIYDLERIMTKVVFGSANGRDLNALLNTALMLPGIKKIASSLGSALTDKLAQAIDPLSDLAELIASAIVDDPPLTIREGGIIRDGFDPRVDELHLLVRDSKSVLAAIETREREATGIKNLKIAYNRVFGYYIEVTGSYLSQVPYRYIRKQTLSNCERYITEELKEVETKVLSAGEKATLLEYEIFTGIRDKVTDAAARIQKTAEAVATLDALYSFAEVSVKNKYVQPTVEIGEHLRIVDGRHPVLEQILSDTLFVPNDTLLDCTDNRAAIITGPNMAGKSTYMRQVAVITLMAQIGCFVPAKSAEIGIVDKIFTRVGASDDLSMGQSTFMVEMSEVAYILKNATRNSLIIFDEIGRGTSTFDGMSIARAVLEYAADRKKLGAKTLFATHYHELTVLEGTIPGVKNYNTAVKKRGDEITFLRRIVRGGADDSYGIEVAKLAGVPDEVIARSKEVLAQLEGGDTGGYQKPKGQVAEEEPLQMTIGQSEQNELIDRLKKMDLNTLTPIESMNLLYELKKKADSITS